jgi:hypothetical protein
MSGSIHAIRLPQMVAGMVVGGGHNGAIGGVGIMTLLGTAIAGPAWREVPLRQPTQQESAPLRAWLDLWLWLLDKEHPEQSYEKACDAINEIRVTKAAK